MRLEDLQTLLFVPATRLERIPKALDSGADAVIVDLEDAVAPAEKVVARSRLMEWLQNSAVAPVLVRINGSTTDWHFDDVALCRLPNVMGIVVPKAESCNELNVIGEATGKPLLPIVESAVGLAGLIGASSIANSKAVMRLLFGKIDLALDLGMNFQQMDPDDPEESGFLLARSAMVIASRCAGLASPIDGVFTALDDSSGLMKHARRGARLGFGGMLLIHPKQVDDVRRCYGPSIEQLADAQRIIQAAEQMSGGATKVDGMMVDAPVIASARRLLERASRS